MDEWPLVEVVWCCVLDGLDPLVASLRGRLVSRQLARSGCVRRLTRSLTHAHVIHTVAAGVFLSTFYKCMSEGVIVRSSALAMMWVYDRT